MELTINLPESVDFESRGIEFSFAFSRIPADKLAEFVATAVVVGITKAGIDAGSSAMSYGKDNGMTVEVATTTLVEKKFSVWETGVWSARGSVDGLSRIETIAREQVRKALQSSPSLKAVYKAADADGRLALIEEHWAKLSPEAKDSAMRWAKAELPIRQAESAAKAARAKEAEGFKLNIGL